MTALSDKDILKMYEIAKTFAKKISVYPLSNVKRGRDIENIRKILGDVDIVDEIYIDNDYINIYCGSFYFISEIYDKLISMINKNGR